jgi:MazG family protein
MNRDRLCIALLALYDLVSTLRGPEGCPWDVRQTDASIRMYLLEEAYEVADAVERGSPEDVCQELGDLLFQVLFLSRLGEERGDFDLLQVMEGIRQKMIQRHPHVFAHADVNTPEEVADQWEEIKRSERSDSESDKSWLKTLPLHLPALLKAHRLINKAEEALPYLKDPDLIRGRVEEKFRALKGAMCEGGAEEGLAEELGDLLFSLTALARSCGFNAEDLLRSANHRFMETFGGS